MAAGFGIWELNLPSSRAIDMDEEDEEDEITPEKELEFTPACFWSPKVLKSLSNTSSNALQCSTLFLSYGKVSSTFLEAYYLCGDNSEVSGVITELKDCKDFDSVLSSKHKEKNELFYRLKDNEDWMFLQCHSHVDEEKAVFWTKKIFEQVKPAKVVILTSSPACEYMTPDPFDLPSDFLKMLNTSEWSKDDSKSPCGFLETPNTVRGFPALVLTHCQIFHIPAVLYICYTATQQLDVQAVKAFGKLLETKEFADLKKSPSQEMTKVLKSLGIGRSSYEHLYL